MSHYPPFVAPDLTPYLNASGVTVSRGQVVYLSSAGQFSLASSSSLATATVLGIVADPTIANGATGNIQTAGFFSTTGLTPGAAYYLTATQGAMSASPPTANGQCISQIGVAPSANGINIDPQTPIPIGAPLTGVTFDALSGKAVPATQAEWDNLLAFVGISSGGPRTILNMQDASSPLVDANGNSTVAITTPGIPFASYRNPVTGWSRVGVGLTNANFDIGFVQQHGNLPDPATHSYLMLAYVQITGAPATDQGLMSNNDSAFYIGIKASTHVPITGSTSGPRSSGSVPLPIGTVFPIVLKFDNTNKVIKSYTPHEILGDVWSTPSSNSGECDFGVAQASGLTTCSTNRVYGTIFAGTSAELEDAQIGALLTAMGWTLDWYTAPIADATSGKFCPVTASQFEALQLAPPQHVWPLQETSGIIYQDVGGDCLLVAQAGITAGNAVSGWSRASLQTTDGTVAEYADSTDARLPDPSKGSIAVLFYARINAAAHGSVGTFWSWIDEMVSGQFCAVFVTTAGLAGIYNNGLGTPGAHNYFDGAAHPFLLKYDKTNSITTLYTDVEKIAGPTFAAQASSTVQAIGSFSGSVPSAGFNMLYRYSLAGQAAEMTDAQARATLQKLGWAVAW